MKRLITTVAATGLLGLSLGATAADANQSDTRFYFTPMLTAAFSDSDTLNPDENLNGMQLSFGRNFGDFFALELYALHFNDTQLDDSFDADSNLDVTGYGVSALLFPARDILPIFAVVGGGIGTYDFDDINSPPAGIPNRTPDVDEQSSTFFDVGAGVMIPVNEYGVAVRAEYRYRSTDVDAPSDGEYSFDDHIFSVGLQIPLGAPAAAEPEVQPAPEPVPAPLQPLDSDGDGVVDPSDQCPGTPVGTAVNAVGCPIEKQAPVVLRGVTFEYDSSTLTPQAQSRLDNVIAALEASPDVQFRIEGHTDSIASNGYNQALSERRAESVRDYLVSHGIDGSRITAVVGYGESRPVASNETAAGRAQNRRVELQVVNQ